MTNLDTLTINANSELEELYNSVKEELDELFNIEVLGILGYRIDPEAQTETGLVKIESGIFAFVLSNGGASLTPLSDEEIESLKL